MEARHYIGAAILLHRNNLGFFPLNQVLAGVFVA
jgi:hypothetical protein